MEERPRREGGLGRGRGPRQKAGWGGGLAGKGGPKKKRGGHAGKAGRKEGAAEKKFTTKSIRCGGVSLQL